MNVENNQRYRDTEERIQKAYWNLVNHAGGHKITVADICREADIHRTTFYGHFLDIYDLQEQAMKKQFMLFCKAFLMKTEIGAFGTECGSRSIFITGTGKSLNVTWK